MNATTHTPPYPIPIPLPAIGQPFEGGLFAGITLDGEQRAALILLSGDESRNWKDAIAWAKTQGGVLPSRIDMLVLFENLRSEFKHEWYWTSEPYAGFAGCAWIQGFGGGHQLSHLKSDDFRCRAVRRVAI